MIIDKVNLNVKISGNKTPFIWAHGLMGSMALEDITGWFQWDSFTDDVKLIRYDARGHGHSEATFKPEDYHWSNLANDLVKVMDNLDISTFIAGGQSMGCATSLYAALSAPRRVSSLILVNPPTAWKTRKGQTEIYEQLSNLVKTKGTSAFASIMEMQPLLPDWLLQGFPELQKHYVNVIRNFDSEKLQVILKGAKGCDLPPRENLKNLHMPALILAWTDDVSHPLSTAEELNALMPNSRLDVAEDIEGLMTWPQKIMNFIISIE